MNRISRLFLVVGLLMAVGCHGELAIVNGTGASTGSPGSGSPGSGSSPGTGETVHTHNPEFPDLTCDDVACRDPLPGAPPRFVRLTHSQWENTVRDVLRLEGHSGLSSSFIPDTLSSGNFDTNAEVLSMNARLWDQYRVAAENLASQIARRPASLERLIPAGAPAELEGRGRAFIEAVGLRAYRRPLTTQEIDSHLELFLAGAELMGSANAFEAGAEMVLRLFLQSPHFVYRTELTGVTNGDVIALGGYERASKLSYALWNTMPDDSLLAAAARGDLDTREGIEGQVRRMLADERAGDVVARFHAQLFKFKDYSEMNKNAELYPEFSRDLAEDMRLEMELFVRDIVFDDPQGSIERLYTAPHTYVNRALADVYGLEGEFDDGFVKSDLDTSERSGILTRLGWLAYESTAYEKNSIHRGVFVNLQVLCMPLPPVPDDTTITGTISGNTNRERLEDATVGCGGACHGLFINPAGFAFEHYDAIGRYQTHEGEHPIDASGEFAFPSGRQFFANALEFSDLIARSPQAHDCYVGHLFEYAYGRQPGANDAPLVARLSQASQAGMASIQEIMVRLVANDIFVSRARTQAQESL
jgi:hypothetical protein